MQEAQRSILPLHVILCNKEIKINNETFLIYRSDFRFSCIDHKYNSHLSQSQVSLDKRQPKFKLWFKFFIFFFKNYSGQYFKPLRLAIKLITKICSIEVPLFYSLKIKLLVVSACSLFVSRPLSSRMLVKC